MVEPIRRIWLKMLVEFSFIIAKDKSNISAMMIWIKSREKKLLSQHLNSPEVDLLIRQRKANGESSTNTLVVMYLTENERISVNEEIEIMLEIMPLNVKRLNLPLSEKPDSLSIKFEKEIFCLKIVCPSEQIKSVKSEVAVRMPEHIWKELKTTSPKTTALIKNFAGDSTSLPRVKCSKSSYSIIDDKST